MPTVPSRQVTSFRCMLASVAILLLMIGVSYFYAGGVTVTVETNAPPGTQVSIDSRGSLLGRGGRAVSFEKIPYGQRQIAVSHPEYEPFSQALSVGWFSSHPQIKAELKPRPVELTVQTTAGAEVFLSGTSIGRAGQDGVLVKQNVLPGDYQISVKLSGYNEWNAQDHLGPPRKTLFAYLQISAEKIRQIEANRAQVFQHIGEARRLFAARNYQGSLATLNAALALDPQNNEAKSLRDQVDQTMKILGGR